MCPTPCAIAAAAFASGSGEVLARAELVTGLRSRSGRLSFCRLDQKLRHGEISAERLELEPAPERRRNLETLQLIAQEVDR